MLPSKNLLFISNLLAINLLLIKIFSILPINGQASNCAIGRSSFSQSSNNTFASRAGQFIDINAPASCDGEIIRIEFCYQALEKEPSNFSEVLVRIWRLSNEIMQTLRVVEEYSINITTSINYRGEAACVNESIKDGKEIKFQQGDFVGFLFPSNIGLELTVADDILTEEEEQGLHRDTRMEDNYDDPLTFDTDLETEVGLIINIKLEISANAAVPVLTSTQAASSLQNAAHETSIIATIASPTFDPLTLTRSGSTSNEFQSTNTLSLKVTQIQSTHVSRLSSPTHLVTTTSKMFITSKYSIPSLSEVAPKLNLLSSGEVDLQTTSAINHKNALSSGGTVTPMNTLHPGNSLSAHGTQMTKISGMLSSSFDLGLQSNHPENTNFIPHNEPAEVLLMPESTVDVSTETIMSTPSLSNANTSDLADMLLPFPTLNSEAFNAQRSEMALTISSKLIMEEKFHTVDVMTSFASQTSLENDGSGESETIFEMFVSDMPEILATHITSVGRLSLAPTSTFGETASSSLPASEVTASISTLLPEFSDSSRTKVLQTFSPLPGLPSSNAASAPATQLTTTSTTASMSSVSFTSSTTALIATMIFTASTLGTDSIEPTIILDSSVTAETTSLVRTSVQTDARNTLVSSSHLVSSSSNIIQIKPTQFLTEPIPGSPDSLNKKTGDVVAWAVVIAVLFATISGLIMFLTLYLSHFRKISKVHTIASDYTVGIDNPSYSMKTSEEGNDVDIAVQTNLSTDEILETTVILELDNASDDNADWNSSLMGSNHLLGLDNSCVPGKNTPSKVVSSGSFKTEVSREEGGSENDFITATPTVVERNGNHNNPPMSSEISDGKRMSSAMSGRTHVYEELNLEYVRRESKSRRRSHQYEEPDHPPEERLVIAQDYEKPVTKDWKRLSLPMLEEDSLVSHAVLPRRNSSACDLTATCSHSTSESALSALPPQRIRHYAEISLQPSQNHGEYLTPKMKHHHTGCQKMHSFSHSTRPKSHDYEEPTCQPFPYSYAVPKPSLLARIVSDYEVPVTTTSLHRTQSTKPEQLSSAVKRRNHLNLILKNANSKLEDAVDPVIEEDETLEESFDGEESNLSVRSEISSDSKLSSPLLSNESLDPTMDGAYISPSSNEQDLNLVISRLSVPAIPHTDIENGWGLNESEQRAVWKKQGPNNTRLDVTIKSADTTDMMEGSKKVDILQEIVMMAQFRHPNIVKLHGVVNDGRHTVLVGEYFPRGDLRKLLVQMGRSVIPSDTPQLLLSYSQQAALGMQYLASKGFVHRDLSARNIFITNSDVCKVGGFDKSRDLANVNDYIAKGGKMQVRWMAPEAVHHCQYSTASDVWSYGCLLYEIWSLGRMPFRDSSNAEVIDKVDSGYRLPPPPGCPLVIYNLMMQCWHPNPFSRPCFKDIISILLKNEDTILKIPIKDASTHSSAIILGASLKAGAYMYTDLQQKYARRASHINRRSVSFKSHDCHDYDHIEEDKFMLTFPTSSADLASEPKSRKRFDLEDSCEVESMSLVPRPSMYSEPVVVSKFSQSLPVSTWTCSDYEDIIDL